MHAHAYIQQPPTLVLGDLVISREDEADALELRYCLVSVVHFSFRAKVSRGSEAHLLGRQLEFGCHPVTFFSFDACIYVYVGCTVDTCMCMHIELIHVYVCICICIRMHLYMCICVLVYAYLYMHMHMHMHVCVCVCVCVCMCKCKCKY